MNEIRDAFLRLVKAGMAAKKMQESFASVGLDDNPIFGIYSEIADAIYVLTGEQSETFEKSKAYLALNVPYLDDERRVRVLMGEYNKNHPEQPAPHCISREQMLESVRKNGGYMTPEGEWT